MRRPIATHLLSTVLLILLGTAVWGRPPVRKLDKGQGESALSLVRVGEAVRFYCKPCKEVVYSTLAVKSVAVEPLGDGYQLVLNGAAVDVDEVYVEDVGSDYQWANLGSLVGFLVEDRPRTLPPAVRDVERLRPHLGTYRGTVNGVEVVLVLRLDTRAVDGSYETASGERRALRATAFNATRGAGESLVLMERDERDRGTAVLRGRFEDDAFAGSWTSLDGKRQGTFELRRAAPSEEP
jgi:hypothetical protein